MKWFIAWFVGSSTGILKYFIKRFGFKAVLFVALKTVQVLVIALEISFFTFFIGFLLNLWADMTTFINSFQHLTVADAQAYGVSLRVILQNAKGFIYASGLSDALVTGGNLFLSFLSLLLIQRLYQVYFFLYIKLYTIFRDGINLLGSS